MDIVKLRLTTSQLRNIQSGKSFQLSHTQLSGHSKGEHEIEIKLPKQHTSKMMKNMSMGKGFRFPASGMPEALGDKLRKQKENMMKKALQEPAMIEGGATYLQRLARRARNTFRPVAKAVQPFVKPALQELKNYAVPIVKDVAKDMVREAITEAITSGVGGSLVRGAPRPLYTQRTTDRIMTHGLTSRQAGSRNGLVHGGSFLPLG